MNHFQSLKELINTLHWSRDLLVSMFEKRKFFAYKWEHALEVLDEDRLHTLCTKGILRRSGAFVEIDEQFQQFFEQVLEVNEEINTSYIHENIQQVKQQINFFLQEGTDKRKYGYLKQIKASLRKIGRITLRNVIDLNRNIENTFKTEPTFAIKISRLESFDEKRNLLYLLIEQTDRLISEQDETIFFKLALDDELKQVVTTLRNQLTESRHNLIETQKQIIEYLNQVKHQSRIIEKIKQIKYLKDQFELKVKTDFVQLIQQNNAVWFEPKPAYRFKLSLNHLHTDEGYQSIRKIQARLKKPNLHKLPVAEMIAGHHLQTQTETEIFINLQEIRNGFNASGNNLYDYIMSYRFPREVDYGEKMTIFCQMASMYENEFNISEKFEQDGSIEYALILPTTSGRNRK